MRRTYGAHMALISERSAFAWAEKLAAEQREPFPLILAELFRAMASGYLPATMTGPLDDWSRKFLLSRAEAVRAEYAVEGKVSRIEGPYRGCASHLHPRPRYAGVA